MGLATADKAVRSDQKGPQAYWKWMHAEILRKRTLLISALLADLLAEEVALQPQVVPASEGRPSRRGQAVRAMESRK